MLIWLKSLVSLFGGLFKRPMLKNSSNHNDDGFIYIYLNIKEFRFYLNFEIKWHEFLQQNTIKFINFELKITNKGLLNSL